MTPYNADTKESYIARMKDAHMHFAKRHHELVHERSMWMQLFYAAMSEDLYGEHWDQLNKETKFKEKNT